MKNYDSGTYLSRDMGYYAYPKSIYKVDNLREFGMKGMVVCPGGMNGSYMAAKHVVASGYPCVALSGGMEGMEKLLNGNKSDLDIANYVIETLNRLEIIHLLIYEARGMTRYPNFISRLRSKEFGNIRDAEARLKALYTFDKP
jgi:hypothetical protein